MKTNINTIIIDDEENALESLALKIEKYFPQITIIHKLQNPQKALQEINKNPPDLLFIDIEMPVLSGFDVLSNIKNPSFEIIFVTAYSEYAIEAIKHCAIGYVLKPIDDDELKKAISNAINNINQKTAFQKNIQLLEHLRSNSSQPSIAIPSQKGLIFIKINNIIRFEGVDGYTKIYIKDGGSILSSYSIGKFSNMVVNNAFYRCHKSHLINLNFVTSILNEGTVLFLDSGNVPCAKTKRTELIQKMNLL